MGSKSRAGLDRFDREQFLRSNGFSPARSGKGSHELWENENMKALAQSAGFKPAENLKKGTIWQVTLCANPGQGTWKAVVSHVEDVRKMLTDAGQRAEKEAMTSRIKKEFNLKARAYDDWKKAVRQELKAGVRLSEAPVSYFEVASLRQQKQSWTYAR